MGIVTGEAIMGANIIRDIFESITDIVGGRSAAYEEKQQRGRKQTSMKYSRMRLNRLLFERRISESIQYSV